MIDVALFSGIQRRLRKQWYIGKQLYRDLIVLGYTGSHVRVAASSRQWRQDQHNAKLTAGEPLQIGPGEAFHFDWSEDCVKIHGISNMLQISHLELGYSRAFRMRSYLAQS